MVAFTRNGATTRNPAADRWDGHQVLGFARASAYPVIGRPCEGRAVPVGAVGIGSASAPRDGSCLRGALDLKQGARVGAGVVLLAITLAAFALTQRAAGAPLATAAAIANRSPAPACAPAAATPPPPRHAQGERARAKRLNRAVGRP